MNITQFSGTIYPDKTFSLGIVPRKKKGRSEKQYDRLYRVQEPTNYSNVTDWLLGSLNVGGKFCSTSEAPLFIESPKSSRARRGKYGRHGITRFGKKFVRNSSLLLERHYTKERLGFVTCTLPRFPAMLQKRINGVWGEIVRRFYQKIKRQLAKLSQPFIYVSVTEIQEKRYRDTGIPVPHLHFVYLCRGIVDKRYWLYVCQIHRAWNEAILEGISFAGYPFGKHPDIATGSVHAKRVKKSVSAYLGKYMTKGSKVIASMQKDGYTEFPRQWWNACMQMKKMFKESLIRLTQEQCKDLFYGCEQYIADNWLSYVAYVEVEIDGVLRTMGVVGTMFKHMYDKFAMG